MFNSYYTKSIEVNAKDSPSTDAFGRWRVSNPVTLFDSKQVFDNGILFWDDSETSGTGTTSTHSTYRASTTIGVTANTAGTRVRQTKMRFNYQPGKSQLIFATMGNLHTDTDITKRFGYFDDNNGLFFESTGGVVSVAKRSNVTQTPTDIKVTQANWNLDKMDGAGFSGVTLDTTKTHIGVIDFEWLGVGRVRMGFVVGGKIHYCHQFLNANALSSVYMSTPNLPLRYEISNGGAGAEDTFEHICSSVVSEGGGDDNGVLRYASTEGTHLSTASENALYAVLGVRLKSAYIGTTIKLISTSLQVHTASSELEWQLIFNPTVAGTFTYADQTNSAVQVAKGATANTITGGFAIAGGFIESGGASTGANGSLSSYVDNALLLGSKIDGTVDEIVLAVRPIAGSTAVDVEGCLNWRELL